MELITEQIRRLRPGMAIGIVTTSEIQDATPAAFWAHTRRRSDKKEITAQLLEGLGLGAVMPDVIMGGGGVYFNGTAGLTGRNMWNEYAAAGYNIALDRASMRAQVRTQ